jgi:hypothetical protein
MVEFGHEFSHSLFETHADQKPESEKAASASSSGRMPFIKISILNNL